MVILPAKSRARGKAAEDAFVDWLRRSKLGYMIVDQTPFSVPIAPEYIKRPDYLVGILNTMIAIDVKARDLFDSCGVIEVQEHEGFNFFQRFFGVSVWYAWYPEKTHARCLLFRNTDIKRIHQRYLKGRTVYAVPVDLMMEFDTIDSAFDYALFMASRAPAE